MELTLDQALQKGIEAHKAGKVQEADQYYTAILKANPKHPDANHNMGVLAVGVGKVEQALPFFKTALEANSSIAQFWLSYIDALIKLERIADAKAVFDQAKSKGTKGDGFNQIEKRLEGLVSTSNMSLNVQEPPQGLIQNLISLYTQGQYQETLNEASKLLIKFPSSVIVYNIIGAANQSLGNLDEAIEAYNRALSIKPDYPDAYNNMGNALKEQGKLEQAIEAYKKTLSIKPDYADAYNNMGITLQQQGKMEGATEAYSKAISIKPDLTEAYNNMGNALKEQDKLDEAIEAYNKALSLKPDYAEAYNNMGNALKEQGKLDEAIEAYNKAISIKPDNAEAYNNTSELLKMYSPKSKRSNNLFIIDNKIKELSSRLLNAKSNRKIVNNLLVGLSYINKDAFKHKTPLSQIYKRNKVNLNCKRHKKIFYTKDIIPEFCFGCFKVQVEVDTVIDLIKVTSIFYKFDFEEDLTRKTIIELRQNISGFYKGLIYCNGLDQAQTVKNLLDIDLKEIFGGTTVSKIKRGCSEYPLKFPKYGKITEKPEDMMRFPKDWKAFEKQFDQNEVLKPDEKQQASLIEYCLSDFYIIQKWIDYAKGIGDRSIEMFSDRPIIFREIYEVAQERKINAQ